MKKSLTLGLLILFIVPQIAMAAWWNPMTWFNNWKFSRTYEVDNQNQALENRIKELEKKLEDNSAAPIITEPEPITIPNPEPVKKTSNIKPAAPKSVTKPIPITSPTVPTSSQPVRDYKALYNDLNSKYVVFRDKTLNIETANAKDSDLSYPNNQTHYQYLTKLQVSLDKDLSELNKRKPELFDSLNAKFVQMVKDYNNEYDRFSAGKKQQTKNLVINYISDYKTTLYEPNTHVHAAYLLDLFDRTFGTKYAPQFRTLLTEQQTIEFANSFLLDMGTNVHNTTPPPPSPPPPPLPTASISVNSTGCVVVNGIRQAELRITATGSSWNYGEMRSSTNSGQVSFNHGFWHNAFPGGITVYSTNPGVYPFTAKLYSGASNSVWGLPTDGATIVTEISGEFSIPNCSQ